MNYLPLRLRNIKFSLTPPVKKTLPKLYVYIVFFGLAATGAQVNFLPNFIWCSNFFGEHSCVAVGNYIVAIVSLPAVPLVTKATEWWPNLSAHGIFIAMFLNSIVFYFLLGSAIDWFLLKRKTWVFTPLQKLVIVVFVILILLFLMLSALN